jgi:DNA polymerase-2
MDSKPGFYDSVVVLDYKSLYPSIIRTFLVDPVGLVEGRHASSSELLIKGPRGTLFSREKHCLPEIVTTLWQARDEAKRARNEPLSQALKLVMNSFAGVLGASECRFFNPDLISAITLRGHEMVKLTRDLVEERGYEVIYGDTDSIFIWLKRPHTTEEAYAVAAKLAQDINAWWIQTLHQEQGLKSFLEIEFDTYYKKFFMPTIRGSDVGSKKRYAGLSVDAAGNESMIYRGLEMARSDWTPLARQFQEGLLSRVFQGAPTASSSSSTPIRRWRARRMICSSTANACGIAWMPTWPMCRHRSVPLALPMSTTIAWSDPGSTRTAAGSNTS